MNVCLYAMCILKILACCVIRLRTTDLIIVISGIKSAIMCDQELFY